MQFAQSSTSSSGRARAARLAPSPIRHAVGGAALACARSRQLGVQFRPQVPLCGRYIADLLAPQARLIVEVDGSSHRLRQQADARRDRMLVGHGFRTVRIPAELVMRDLVAAVGLVRAALER
jgi:very-short-patch-repair endonuclease